MLLLFAATLAVGSCLLFLVEPMFAKMALPFLGGTPAVWNTCMVFFQAALLAGYAFAHSAAERVGARRQAALHVGLLFLPLMLLPIRLRASLNPPVEQNPIPWLLLTLLVSVGLPFFMLSTVAPTLQIWFANTGHSCARDPYFLYGASNLGSMVALLSYPLVIEPRLRLVEQSRLWTWGYGLFVLLIAACAVALWISPAIKRGNPRSESKGVPSDLASEELGAGPTAGQRLRWVGLAFIPSSLMLGVTTVLTTDIPPIPLFWIIPLAIYLATFVLVFARKPVMLPSHLVGRLPFLILAAMIPLVLKATFAVWMQILLDLGILFVAAMVCHGELAKSRPSAAHLTEYYLWLSAGGVLGGLFNALIAPVIFKTVLEFPAALLLLALVRPCKDAQKPGPSARRLDYLLPTALALLIAMLLWGAKSIGLNPGPLLHLAVFGPAMVFCLSFARRRVRFVLGLVALLVMSALYTGPFGHVLETQRSFFGVYRVTEDNPGSFHQLFHGGTIHGLQNLDPSRRLEPLSYFSRTGPIGQVFGEFAESGLERNVGIIGLGTGTMACYGTADDRFTFYEIDPLVERIARDPRYFTFLRDCSPRVSVVLGDARLSMRNAPDGQYGMIILDAFSSDSIPMHLLTREAMALYLRKLADGGVLAFNVSNRYLDLQPVLGNLARDAGLVCLFRDDRGVSQAEIQRGKFPSRWAVMARRENDLTRLAGDARWKWLSGQPGTPVWSDDFSNILGIIKWD